jgi:hypothetical protein
MSEYMAGVANEADTGTRNLEVNLGKSHVLFSESKEVVLTGELTN